MNNSLFVTQIFSLNLFIKKKTQIFIKLYAYYTPFSFNPKSAKIMWNYENTLLGQLTSRECRDNRGNVGCRTDIEMHRNQSKHAWL
jgi:hypothetical protein